MLEICLLGTGGMAPLPERWLSAMMCRLKGSNLLIDCGEGTQIAIAKKGWSVNPIDIICITHFHADHIAGLPGLLLTMAKEERKRPVTIIGPKGLGAIVNALCVIAPKLPFKIIIKEIGGPKEIFSIGPYEIHAFCVEHSATCYAYTLKVNRNAKFLPEKAQALSIPVKYWNILQHGKEIELNGIIFHPEQVIGEKRNGLKVVYCTDTRPCSQIISEAHEADLFICEGMYGEKDKERKAKEKKHMMMNEAAEIAKMASVKRMWFTHYSPSMKYPENHMQDIKKIFPDAIAAKDGQTTTLQFEK